jgi:F-type H+-transporting ATPase subunit delta
MQNVSVARRYARALLDASQDKADQILSQLDELVQYLRSNSELMSALSNPALSRAQRMSMTERLVGALQGIHPMLGNTLRLLTDRNRFGSLPSVALQFRALVDQRLGRVRGLVTSAALLKEAEISAIKAQLEAMTQRAVVLETRIDPSILGGIVATVGSRTYDSSLRSQLKDMGRQLLG